MIAADDLTVFQLLQPFADRGNRETNGVRKVIAFGPPVLLKGFQYATNQEITRLERALTFLATTASATPFIGLFGTVWGIMTAFRGLSVTQSSSIQAVAPGIAEALIATATGLVAAIPAVVAYNHFARQIRVLSADMENFSSEFLNIAERHFLK